MNVETGQVAVVTGAAQGLGRGIAGELVARGLSVVLADQHADTARAAAEELAATGGTVISTVVDVSNPESMSALAQQVVDRFGRVDLVVNNAGIVPTDAKPLWEADLAQWQRVVEVNLLGTVHGIRAFVPHLVAAGRGHVVNIASIAGLAGTPMAASYGATKHAVVATSEALHAELEMSGSPVGVTVVCPGYVRTPMVEDTQDMTKLRELADRLGEDSANLLASFEETMQDMLEPDEAARRILAAVEADVLHALPSGDVADGARTRTQRILEAINTAVR